MNLVLLMSLGIISIEGKLSSTNMNSFSDDFMVAINKKQSLWKAGRNFGKDTSMNYIVILMGRRLRINQPKLLKFNHNILPTKIPNEFDWRDHYPNCSTIRSISDQGPCGCCWAFATVEVISDRICIYSKGKTNVYISAENVLSCCKSCGDGCNGGNEFMAFKYWINYGIVSGGPYGSNEGCQPYEIASCEQSTAIARYVCAKRFSRTPNCKRSCRRGYPISYEKDLYFGKAAYSIPQDVRQIKAEIMINGPVTAGFDVYADFLHYKAGVYKHVMGEYLGGHAVKILGWGVENGNPYWLAANSWNSGWGDSGFFKIFQGDNQCDIEKDIVAGLPA